MNKKLNSFCGNCAEWAERLAITGGTSKIYIFATTLPASNTNLYYFSKNFHGDYIGLCPKTSHDSKPAINS